MDRPFVVACIPAFNEERSIVGVVVRALRHVDWVVDRDLWRRIFKKVDLNFQDGSYGDRRGD